mgnify:CR=1 FL=1
MTCLKVPKVPKIFNLIVQVPRQVQILNIIFILLIYLNGLPGVVYHVLRLPVHVFILTCVPLSNHTILCIMSFSFSLNFCPFVSFICCRINLFLLQPMPNDITRLFFSCSLYWLSLDDSILRNFQSMVFMSFTASSSLFFASIAARNARLRNSVASTSAKITL